MPCVFLVFLDFFALFAHVRLFTCVSTMLGLKASHVFLNLGLLSCGIVKIPLLSTSYEDLVGL